MLSLTVPTVACVIGEGGSGGALALAVSDRVLMQENAIYSVITPEGCAMILWRDREEKKKAAAAFKPDAFHCYELGVVDGIVSEPRGGAQDDPDAAAASLAQALAGAPGARRPIPGRASPVTPCEVPGDGRLQLTATPRRLLHIVHRVFNHVLTGCNGGRLERWRSSIRTGQNAAGPTPEPFGGSPRGEQRRSSSSSATRRAPSTTTSGSNATVCSPPGRCRRAFRWRRARGRSQSTSRITRSTTDPSRGDPEGLLRRRHVEIWDRGAYELLEDKPDGGLKVRLHGERLQGVWTLVPAHLDGKEQNWLLIRSRDADYPAHAAAASRSTPDARDARGRGAEGKQWLYEVKFDGYRALAYLSDGRCELGRGPARISPAASTPSRSRSPRGAGP